MIAYNQTHLHFEQISVDKLGAPIDDFWVIKDAHVSYATATEHGSSTAKTAGEL